MRTLRILFALVGVLWVCPAASAQQPTLAEGVRLRVELGEGNRKTGVLKGLTKDELTVALDRSGKLVRLPVAEIRVLQVSRGTRTTTWRGALGGALTGAAVGLLLVLQDPPDEYIGGLTCAVSTFLAGGGFLVGALVGSQVKTDRWEKVPLPSSPRSRPQPAPGVHLTLRF